MIFKQKVLANTLVLYTRLDQSLNYHFPRVLGSTSLHTQSWPWSKEEEDTGDDNERGLQDYQ